MGSAILQSKNEGSWGRKEWDQKVSVDDEDDGSQQWKLWQSRRVPAKEAFDLQMAINAQNLTNIRLISKPFHTDHHPISLGSPLPRHSSDTSLDLHQLLSTLARFDSISNGAKSAACTASKMVGFPSLYLPIPSLWKSIRNQLKLGFVLQLDRFNDLSTRSSNSPIQENLEPNLGDKGNTADVVCCMQQLQVICADGLKEMLSGMVSFWASGKTLCPKKSNGWDDPHVVPADMTVEVSELFTRELTRYIQETDELAMKGLTENRQLLDLISRELLENSRITRVEVKEKLAWLLSCEYFGLDIGCKVWSGYDLNKQWPGYFGNFWWWRIKELKCQFLL
ncbi:hypothetical protein LXL04_022573 [Taraxacum kok-saghyz]